MKPFAFARPKTYMEALSLLSPTARPKGGGIDLLDLAKSGHSGPAVLVQMGRFFGDLKPVGIFHEDTQHRTEVAVQAGATLALLASSPELRENCPMLADAAAEAATPQIRNVATLAGNLLQRPRCPYFRDPFFDCLKRGGRTCPAMEGDHSEGAVFGNSTCCATHPSNLAPALLAADANFGIDGISKEPDSTEDASQAAAKFFVVPEEDPLRENHIGIREILREVRFAPCPASAYVEVNQKQSFDWASASAAVVLRLEGGKVADCRIVLGAVAPVPWRAEAAEAALKGKVPDEAAATAAGEAAVQGATPLRDNGHKVQQVKVCVKRAILKAAERGR